LFPDGVAIPRFSGPGKTSPLRLEAEALPMERSQGMGSGNTGFSGRKVDQICSKL
jgi:hypothetical protein